MGAEKPSNYIEELNKEDGLYEVRADLPNCFAESEFKTTAQQINNHHHADPENIQPVCIVWYPYLGIVERAENGYLDISTLRIFTPTQEAYHPEPPKDSHFPAPKNKVGSITNLKLQGEISRYQNQGYRIIHLTSLTPRGSPLIIEAGGSTLYCGWCGKKIDTGNAHQNAKLFYCPDTDCKTKAHDFDKAFPKFLKKWHRYNELKENDPDNANKLKQKSRRYAHLFDNDRRIIDKSKQYWDALRLPGVTNHKLGLCRAEIIRMLWPVCPNCGEKIPDSRLSLVAKYCSNKCKDAYNNKKKKV